MKTKCPHCGHVIKLKEEWLGRKIKCPSCKEAFRLPDAMPEPKKSAPKASAKAAPKSAAKLGAKSKAASAKSAKPAKAAKPASKGTRPSSKAAAPTKKKRSAPGAAASSPAKSSGAPKRKSRPRPQQGNPYKGLVNTLLILGICAPYIFFYHNEQQSGRMAEIAEREEENKMAREKIANQKTLEQQMKIEAREQAKKDRQMAKASLNEEARVELEAEEKRLSEATYKEMMANYLAIGAELKKEVDDKLGAVKKKVALDTMKNKSSDDVGQMQQPKDPFFKDNVINVFMNRCHKCHGNEEAKGGLRLHTLAATIQGGDGGASIVPGDAEKSLLVELIKLDEDDDDIMPPKGGKLTDKEIAAIEKWINDGAKW